MKQKKMLALTLSQLEQLYRHELPELVSIAVQSDDAEAFKANLTEYIAGHPEVDNEAGKQIRLLIEFDGQEVHELSIGEQLPISTLSMLHSFLTGQWEEETETDLFIDLFQQFKRLHQPAPTLPSAQKIKTLTERWPSGLDEDVQHIRAKNKERILHALVQKIEHRKNPASRFHFEEGLSYEEKFNLVSEWWNDFRFHLAMAVKSPTELNRLLGNSLSAETMYLLSKARKKGMPFFATPYYLSLLNCTGSGYDDEALRSYILYSPQLVETYGQIRAWEREDIKKLRRLMAYFEEDTQLRDILITGGDALMSQNKTLGNILDAVYRMAVRKRKANQERPEGEKYAELQRVRLGSRLPAYLPMRINDGLVEILREFKEKASTIGIHQFIIQTHFQTPLEVTPEAAEGIRKLLAAGWLIDNQLVYNVAASRRGHTTRLRQVLNQLGVVCYYTFSVKGFEENNAVFTPNSRSVQEQREEKRFGKLTKEDAHNLSVLLGTVHDPAACIRRFLKTHHLPFLATDRNVLNLPAIGKSMTFNMVGITPEGKRILRFDHDSTRRHSPIIDRLGQIYIVENKSIASYLRQLQAMGEDAEEYATIWNYTEGKTESRFSLYEYPDFPFQITDRMSNQDIAG